MINKFDFYNPNEKKRFLERYQERTAQVYGMALAKCATSERFYGKDVSEFTYEEYVHLLQSLNARSYSSIMSQHSAIRQYIEFAIKINFANPNRLLAAPDGKFSANVANLFKPDDLMQFLRADAREQQYLTSEELDEFIEFCANAQDAALIQALRAGIKGIRSEELINLQIHDINTLEQYVELRDSNGERLLNVDRKTINLLLEADKQKKYLRKNGESTHRHSNAFYLPETPYVFKPTGRKNVNQPVNDQILRRRLASLANLYGNPFLNITNIWTSGMIEYGQKLKKQHGKLTLQHYEEMCRKYGRPVDSASMVRTSLGKYIEGV